MAEDFGNVGYATLTVLPSFRGISARMDRELAGIMPVTGQRAGSMMGSGLTSGFSKALKIGGPIALAGAAFLKTLNISRDFEAQISGIAAVSGATGGALDQLRQKALQLGADTAFSASESASAMEELVKAGISVEGVLGGAADAAVALAAAGGVGIATASEIAANAMNQFGLAASDMPQIADLVAAAANNSAISVEDFAYSLQMSGAVANLVGLDFEDTAAAITAMGNAGIKGSDAGTSLKTMLMRLEPTTDRASTLMSELGIITEAGANQFFDYRGEVKSLADISGVLAKALEGQTRQQQLATLNTLFGADAIRAAAVLYDQGAAGIDKITEANRKLSAEEIAAARLDNLNGALEQLSGSAETLAIKAGSHAIPAVRLLVETMNSAVDFMASPPSGFFDPLISAGRDLADTGENVVSILGDIVRAGQPLAEFGAILGAGAAVGGLTVLAEALETTTDFLADHSSAVYGVVAAYAAFRGVAVANVALSKLTTVGLTAAAAMEALAVKTAAAGLSFSTAGTAITAMRTKLAAVATGATGAAIGIGALAGAAAYGYSEWQKWGAEGREMAENSILSKLRGQLDGTAQSYLDVAEKARWAGTELRAEARGTWGFWNEDKKRQLDEGAAAMEEFSRESVASSVRLTVGLSGLQAATGLNETQLQNWAKTMEIDLIPGLADGSVNISEFAGKVNEMRVANGLATPATETLSEAVSVMADETKSAKEQLDAYKQLVDSLFGAQMSVWDATTAWGQALQNLESTLKENAMGGINEFTAAGVENRNVIKEIAEAGLNMVESLKATGQTEAAANHLRTMSDTIAQFAENAGVARGDMHEFLAELGLTPDKVDVLLQATLDQTAWAQANADLDWAARDRRVRFLASLEGATDANGDPLRPGRLNTERLDRRWGGLESYRHGGIPQAMYANRTMYQWAEPATGGEVFVPRNGRPARSVPHLRTAAGWYGYDLVPKRPVPMALGGLSGETAAPMSPSDGASDGGVHFHGDIKLATTTDPKRHAIDLFRHLDTQRWLRG